MKPKSAAFLLSCGSAILSAGTIAATSLVVIYLAAETPIAAEHGHWSIRQLEAFQPFGTPVAVASVVVLAIQAAALLRSGTRRYRSLVTAWRTSRDSPDGLVVLDDPALIAYAVPGWPGRIVTSSSLLDAFSATERRVVFAHEQAHLDGHHELHLTAASLAAAVNPFLFRIPAATRMAAERWADEVAAVSVGDRRLVAEPIVRAAATDATDDQSILGLGMSSHDLFGRVHALLEAPPSRRHLRELGLGAPVLLAAVAAGWFAHDTKHLIETAEQAVRVLRPR